MIVLMWFVMVGFVVLVGFVTLGVVFTHYFKEWRAKKKAEISNVSNQGTANT